MPASDLATNCAIDYAIPGAYSDIGANCHSPGGVDQNGAAINSGKLATVNPADAAYTKYYPAINRTPQPTITGQVSDGINWVENIPVTNNGYQLHSRVDENISDSLKLYGVYNWEKVNSENPLNNIFYNPPDTVPYPTPLYSHGDSNYVTLNLTKVVSNSVTNELIASGMFFNEPEQFGKRSLASATGTPWETAGYEGGPLKNGNTQLPWIYSYEWNGVPNFSMGNVPADGRGEYYRKSSWNISDNLTKVYHTHTLEGGCLRRTDQKQPGRIQRRQFRDLLRSLRQLPYQSDDSQRKPQLADRRIRLRYARRHWSRKHGWQLSDRVPLWLQPKQQRSGHGHVFQQPGVLCNG